MRKRKYGLGRYLVLRYLDSPGYDYLRSIGLPRRLAKEMGRRGCPLTKPTCMACPDTQ